MAKEKPQKGSGAPEQGAKGKAAKQPRREREQDMRIQVLAAMGMTDYGALIPTEVVHELAGIVMPEVGTKQMFDSINLKLLTFVDLVRSELLKEGKYLATAKAGYRILLPSENMKQVEAYIEAAQRKLHRASLLSRNTPAEFKQHDQTLVRIEMARAGARSRFTGDPCKLS